MAKTPQLMLLIALAVLSVLELGTLPSAMLFCAAAALLWQFSTTRAAPLPPVAFVIVAYVLGFPSAALLPDLYPQLWGRVPSDAIEFGMRWAARGFIAFAIGYALVENALRRRDAAPALPIGTDAEQRRYLVFVLASIGGIALVAWLASAALFGLSLVFIPNTATGADTMAGSSLQVLTLLSRLRYPFFLGFLLLLWWSQTTRALTLLCVGLLLVSIIEILVAGSKEAVIQLIVIGLVAMAFLPVRLRARHGVLVVAAVVAVYGSFSVITEYRAIMQDKRLAGLNVQSFPVRIESFGAAVTASLPYAESAIRRTEVSEENVFGRFGSGIFSFANLLRFTGQQSPHEHAWESFLIPLYSVVPRAWLPDKPEFFHSGRNAREYYGWAYGGVSVSLLGSLYFAWGYAGVVLGMACFGAALAFMIGQTRMSGRYQVHWLVLLVMLLVPMLDVGVTFQTLATNTIRVAVLLWLLHTLYRTARRRMAPPAMPIRLVRTRNSP